MMAPRILVVEDERIVALHLRQKLISLGYDAPVSVSTGAAALGSIAESRPDLILMDIHLEGPLDGITASGRIPGEYHIPVIYLTAYSEDSTLTRAAATNPHGYLLKPFSERELHAMIQMALARSRAEAALRAAEASIRQAHKMEAIGKLTGGVAHEFNNLLTIMFGNLEELSDHTSDDIETNQLVRNVLFAATKGEKLIRQLLTFSQRGEVFPSTVSIGQVVANMTIAFDRMAGEDIRIRPFLPSDLWKIRVDEDELEKALTNLAENACDAMPNGGRLTIDGENVWLDKDRAKALSNVRPGQYICLTVTDTGAGMTERVAASAFDPFFTTKPPGRGTGLGLSQVFGFVKQAAGHIDIDSQTKAGTTITIYLPAAQDEREVAGAAVHPGPDARARPNEVVLLVEGQSIVRGLVTGVLTSLGYQLIAVEDNTAALGVLEDTARIDLLLIDTGVSADEPRAGRVPVDIVREALLRRPGLKVLYTSVCSRDALVSEGSIARDAPLLGKPFRRADLVSAVRGALDGTTASGALAGTIASGALDDTTASGALDGTTASGALDDTTASGALDGTTAIPDPEGDRHRS